MMLRELHIKNFSIIDDITVEFGEGLNVITGETGAGKSIIIDALSLALGDRAAGDFIRSGEKEAVIEAFFDVPPEIIKPSVRRFLEDNGIDTADGLILKRIISVPGRNRAYINSSMVNVQTLADVSSSLIDIHGQYEHQSLLSSDNQLDMLDAFGGLLSDRQEVENAYEGLMSIKGQIAELLRKEKERAQRLDMLQFQLNEIETAALAPDEEEALAEELKILGNAGRLMELANHAYAILYDSESSCIEKLSNAINDLSGISGIDARAADALNDVKEALPLLEEASHFLRDYRDGLDFDPQRLDQVQDRLELIKNLKRKYGSSITEVLDYREKASAEFEGLKNSEERLGALNAELEGQRKKLTEKAGRLSEKRKSAAKKIESRVMKELSDLSMPGAVFSVGITNTRGDDTTDGFKVSRSGIDHVSFLISANVGEELRPVSKTASGGELSRIMLALKGTLAKGDKIPVLVFDEIDAGIGGRAAETVGQKLNLLSSSHQLICITHLPQIASYAAAHLKIEKKVIKQRTSVEIRRLQKGERTEEIARMLSGKTSELSLKHAEELLEQRAKS